MIQPRTVVFLFLTPFLFHGRGWALYSSRALNVAAEGLGGAFVARADNSPSIFLNPAGLVQLNRGETSFQYGRPWMGLPGVSLQQASVALGLPAGPRWGWGLGISHFDAVGLLQEQELVWGAARRFRRLSLGGSVELLRRAVQNSSDPMAVGDPVQGRSRTAVGWDVGLLYGFTRDLQGGVALRRINRPDVGLSSPDRVPMEGRAGGLYRWRSFSVTADVSQRGAVPEGTSRSTWALGGEWRPSLPSKEPAPLALRGGLHSDGMALGLGVVLGTLTVDYAYDFLRTDVSESSGAHRMALSARFGAPRVSPTPVPSRGRPPAPTQKGLPRIPKKAGL